MLCDVCLGYEKEAHRLFGFFARVNDHVKTAVSEAAENEKLWVTLKGGGNKDGPSVCGITESVDLKNWPKGTRLIRRREPLHPGARTTFFPRLDYRFVYRFVGFYTHQPGDSVKLDLFMRECISIKDAIGDGSRTLA